MESRDPVRSCCHGPRGSSAPLQSVALWVRTRLTREAPASRNCIYLKGHMLPLLPHTSLVCSGVARL